MLYELCDRYEKRFFDYSETERDELTSPILGSNHIGTYTDDSDDLWSMAMAILSERRHAKYPGLLSRMIYLEMTDRLYYILVCAATILGHFPASLNRVARERPFQIAIFSEDHEMLTTLIEKVGMRRATDDGNLSTSERPFLALLCRYSQQLAMEAGYSTMLLVAIKHHQLRLYSGVIRRHWDQESSILLKQLSRALRIHDTTLLHTLFEDWNQTSKHNVPIESELVFQEAIFNALRARCALCLEALLSQFSMIQQLPEPFLWILPILLTFEEQVFRVFKKWYCYDKRIENPFAELFRDKLFRDKSFRDDVKEAYSMVGSLFLETGVEVYSQASEVDKAIYASFQIAFRIASDPVTIELLSKMVVRDIGIYKDYKIKMGLMSQSLDRVRRSKAVDIARSSFQQTCHNLRTFSKTYVEENERPRRLDKHVSFRLSALLLITIGEVLGEVLGLKFEIVNGDRVKAKEATDYEQPVPKALETQENYAAWREQVILILEEAIADLKASQVARIQFLLGVQPLSTTDDQAHREG